MSSKLTDGTPVKEIEINTEAKNPDVELNVLFHTENLCDEINNDEVNFLASMMNTKNVRTVYHNRNTRAI